MRIITFDLENLSRTGNLRGGVRLVVTPGLPPRASSRPEQPVRHHSRCQATRPTIEPGGDGPSWITAYDVRNLGPTPSRLRGWVSG
jgi:hypothetical protein